MTRCGRLHDAARMFKSLQKKREASTLRSALKPDGKFAGIGCGQPGVFLIAGKFDNGLRTEAAVEMIVEKNFWNRAKEILGELHRGGRK